ncbi:MAG: hypothetical protein ACP5XB_22550 [Isosphaeraceae bacterium]
MALVVVVAIGLAALHSPSYAWASAFFTLAVVLPLGAVLAAISCKGSARLPWIGFALFGFFFLNVSFNLGRIPPGPTGMYQTPDTLPVHALREIARVANPDVWQGFQPWSSQDARTQAAWERSSSYVNCCNSLGVIFFSFLGALLGHWLQEHPIGRQSPPADARGVPEE